MSATSGKHTTREAAKPWPTGRTDFESPRISAAEAGEGDYVVHVTWDDGTASRVDLTAPIFALKPLRALRNKKAFRDVRVGDWGWSIAWGDDLDFSAERLWEMAREQANADMVPSDFREWLKRNRLTQEEAARLLGISKRSIANYSTGAQPISRIVALALKGADRERQGKQDRARQPAPGAPR